VKKKKGDGMIETNFQEKTKVIDDYDMGRRFGSKLAQTRNTNATIKDDIKFRFIKELRGMGFKGLKLDYNGLIRFGVLPGEHFAKAADSNSSADPIMSLTTIFIWKLFDLFTNRVL
jgi:hypothetical protein